MVISPVHFPKMMFWPRRRRGDSFFDSVFYFQRGSWALAHGIMAIAKKRGKERMHVRFPDYFCKEPLEILKQFPIDVDFYPVTKNLTPDWATLGLMASSNRMDAMVLVHYFGFPNDIAGAQHFCQKHGLDLIEDCAHVMAPFGKIGTTGAVSVFSPWKFMPLPDLGFLLLQKSLFPFVEASLPSWEVRKILHWFLKRKMQQTLCTIGINWYRSKPGTTDLEEQNLVAANKVSIKLFQSYEPIFEHAKKKRIQNYTSFEAFLKTNYPNILLYDTLLEGMTPYVLATVLQGSAETYSHIFIQKGIPAYPWPSLPKEVKDHPEKYSWANWYAQHTLLFPIHQNVSLPQVEYMKGQMQSILYSSLC